MQAERRRHSRTRTRVDQDLHCSSLEAQLGSRAPANLAVRLIDVGPKGACLVTSGRLRPGLRVEFGFIPRGTREPVRATAVVRWSTTVTSGHRSADVTGLEFDAPVKALLPGAATGISSSLRRPDPHRRHRRFKPGKADVVLVPRDLWASVGWSRRVESGIMDLSLGGAQIVSHKPLKVGQEVDLELSFRYPQLSVRAGATVRWCRRDTLSLEGRWFAGVVFKKVDAQSDSHLKTVEAFFVDPS